MEVTEEIEAIPDTKPRNAVSKRAIGEINRLHKQYGRTAVQMIEQGIELGEKLRVAKEKVKHGQWTAWVEENLDFPIRTAQRYMEMAEQKDSPLLLSDPSEFLAQINGNTKTGKSDVTSFSDEGGEDEAEGDDEEKGGGGRRGKKQHGGEGLAFDDKQKFTTFKSVAFELDRQFFLHLTISVEEKLNFIRELRLWLDDKEQILLGDADAPENEEL